MEAQREHIHAPQPPPPPPYQSHNPAELQLPSVPQSDIPNTRHAQSDLTLPDLQSVLADVPARSVHSNAISAAHEDLKRHGPHIPLSPIGRNLPRPEPSPRCNGYSMTSIDSAIVSPSDTASVMSVDEQSQTSQSFLSPDDPDVQLAAQALAGLGKSGYVHSQSASASRTSSVSHSTSLQQEPHLLELLTDAHPIVGNTISGSLSAYNTAKNYSPRLIQTTADYMERNIGSPFATTVGTVGRRTGIESGLRWYLDRRPPGEMERTPSASSSRGADSNKRRRIDEMDVEQLAAVSPRPSGGALRRDSQDYLPAYRSSKPPSYREEVSPHGMDRSMMRHDRPPHARTWSQTIMYQTSGLSVALSETSRLSLQYCVKILTDACRHIENLMNALRIVLSEYDQMKESNTHQDARRAKEAEAGILVKEEKDQAAEQLARRIKPICDSIMNTIQTVVTNVSSYAGAALPTNAREYVKRQLLSVPQRWRWASQRAAQDSVREDRADGGEAGPDNDGDGEARKAAHRMIVFAKEGIDMMSQVNGVVQITLEKADEWLQRFGRNNTNGRDEDMVDADDAKDASH